MKLFFTLSAFLFLSLNSFAACFNDTDAQIHNCIRVEDSPKADKWCREKYGRKFKAYITDNNCSHELAFESRGQKFNISKFSPNTEIPVACMSFEQGSKRECRYYDYDIAQLKCASLYGAKYLAFIPDKKKCTLSAAAKTRGEHSASSLTKGLKSDIEEIEKIMTMIDKQGLEKTLLSFINKKPMVSGEFYTGVVKELMRKMELFKTKVLTRSEKYKVALNSTGPATIIKYSFRYLSVLSRLYKIYAYVAHNNNFALKSYKYENLNHLNLVLPKVYAFEILSRVNFKVKTSFDNDRVEFLISEQEKQTYEYLAMSDPKSKVDYAKLLTFLGARESITNLWGVQRITKKNIVNSPIRSCGDFLSFKVSGNRDIKKSNAYQSLDHYDLYYGDFSKKIEKVKVASQKVSLLNKKWAEDLGYFIVANTPNVKKLLADNLDGDFDKESDVRNYARENVDMLLSSENDYWSGFSKNNLYSLILPGDNIESVDYIITKITRSAYERRLDAIKGSIIRAHIWVDDASVRKMESLVDQFVEKFAKNSFVSKMRSALMPIFRDYNSQTKVSLENKNEKIKETMKILDDYVHAAYVRKLLDVKDFDIKNLKNFIEPSTLEELAILFQGKVSDYEDLRQTLHHNKELAKLSGNFFKDIAEEFKKKYVGKSNGNKQTYKSSKEERSKGLRQIAFSVAKKYLKKYPIIFTNLKGSGSSYRNANKAEQGRVSPDGLFLGVDKNSVPSKRDLQKHYMSAQDNTYVHNLNYAYGPGDFARMRKIPERESGNNADKISTGEVSLPLKIDRSYIVKDKEEEIAVKNKKYLSLFYSSDHVSEDILKTKDKVEKNYESDSNKSKLIFDARFFLGRILEVLNLKEATRSSNTVSGSFSKDKKSQQILSHYLVSLAFQNAPMLRIETSWTEEVPKFCTAHKDSFKLQRCGTRTVKRSAPLLYKISSYAYNANSKRVNTSTAKSEINKVLAKAVSNIPDKVNKFCGSNFNNFKNSDNFKFAFKASKYLRSNLKDPTGGSVYLAHKMKNYDESVRKEIRGKLEAANEEWLTPTLHILGAASLVATAVVLIIGTGGASVPGILGAVYAFSSSFLAIEFFASFALTVGSLYSKINTNFIEVPAQLKFQHSLALSQIDDSKIVDWDMLDRDREENRSNKMWTVGLMPLDFMYGAMMVSHVRRTSGIIGKNAMEVLTGVKLKGFSVPATKYLFSTRFKDLRKLAAYKKSGILPLGKVMMNADKVGRYFYHFTPRFQDIPESMIKSSSLRIGLARQAKKAKLDAAPWELIKDIDAYSNQLKSALKKFQTFSAKEDKIIEAVRLNRRLSKKEILKYGIEVTAMLHLPKSLLGAYQKTLNSKSLRPLISYFTEFGDVWSGLKTLQGSLVQKRANQIDSVLKKLQEFKKAVDPKKVNGENVMAHFIKKLSDDEILVLEEIARSSNGKMSVFKQTFKLHKKVVEGLRPSHYISSYSNRAFRTSTSYLKNAFTENAANSNYDYKNPADDLINYYESLIKNEGLGVELKEFQELRDKTERLFGKEIVFDRRGVAKKI